MQSAVGLLENANFVGQAKCEYVIDLWQEKKTRNIQERLEL